MSEFVQCLFIFCSFFGFMFVVFKQENPSVKIKKKEQNKEINVDITEKDE